MRYVVIGAGAHLTALQDNGLRPITTAGVLTRAIPAVGGAAELGELRPDDGRGRVGGRRTPGELPPEQRRALLEPVQKRS